MSTPPSLSTRELREHVAELAHAEQPWEVLEALLAGQFSIVPGRGWLVVIGYEASGQLTAATLPAGPALDRLQPDLARLNGRIFFDGGDLSRAQAAAAARVEASFAFESAEALQQSYPGADDDAALAAIHGSAQLHDGVPEVCLGVSAWVKTAG